MRTISLIVLIALCLNVMYALSVSSKMQKQHELAETESETKMCPYWKRKLEERKKAEEAKKNGEPLPYNKDYDYHNTRMQLLKSYFLFARNTRNQIKSKSNDEAKTIIDNFKKDKLSQAVIDAAGDGTVRKSSCPYRNAQVGAENIESMTLAELFQSASDVSDASDFSESD